MPGFQPLGRPRPALCCEAGGGYKVAVGGGVDVDAVVIAVAFTRWRCVELKMV